MESKQSELKSLLSRKPYPHAENVVILSNTIAVLSGTDPSLSATRWLTKLSVNSLGFLVGEFGGQFTTRGLIAAITADGIAVPTAPSEIESLNNLLIGSSLHSKFPRITKTKEVEDLIKRESTLSSKERIELNRLILEAAYALKCPKKALNIKASAFNPMLVQQKNKLMAAAKKYGVTVPSEFGFGFGRYVTHGTPPANDTNQINTLLTQWSAVEMLADILFTNRIVSIAVIRRAPVGAEIPRDPNAAAMGLQVRGGDEFCGALVRDNPNEIARTLPFELEFICDTQGLRGILSALESSPRFFIVRSVAVLNSRSNEMLAGGRSEAMGKAQTAAEAGADPSAAPGAPPAPGAPGGRPAGPRGEAGKLAEPIT
ncbi:MAG: Amuc_1100 family pilus-like protein, partial [Verrucomicrobia bacterium]|nr:Amuc_1100 family pilus-like protein [Verrucomicrobiota bacterium]